MHLISTAADTLKFVLHWPSSLFLLQKYSILRIIQMPPKARANTNSNNLTFGQADKDRTWSIIYTVFLTVGDDLTRRRRVCIHDLDDAGDRVKFSYTGRRPEERAISSVVDARVAAVADCPEIYSTESANIRTSLTLHACSISIVSTLYDNLPNYMSEYWIPVNTNINYRSFWG